MELAGVAAQVRTLTLPPGRWLVRPGRELADLYFLERGRLRLHGGELLDARSPLAVQPLQPANAGVRTLRDHSKEAPGKVLKVRNRP